MLLRRNLIKARLNERLTQAQLGKMIGRSKQTISCLERCRVQGKVTTWDKLEAVLKVPAKKLREISE